MGFVGDRVPLNIIFGEEAKDVSAIVNDSESETEDAFECKEPSLACEQATPVDADRCKSVVDGIRDKVSSFILSCFIFASRSEIPPLIAARKASLMFDRVRRCSTASWLVG